MKTMKKDLKDAIAIVKRMVDKKEGGTMLLEAKGDGKIHIQAKTKDENLLFYKTIESLDDDVYCFHVAPHDIDPLLKGKNEEMTFVLTQKKMTLEGTKTTIAIERDEEMEWYEFGDFTDAKNPEKLISILKESEVVLKKNEELNNMYLKISTEKALVSENEQAHFFNVCEPFPFNGGYIYKDVVGILAKSLKGMLEYSMWESASLEKRFVIKNNDCFFLIKMEHNIVFPEFKKRKLLNEDFSFNVSADEVNACLKEYKKEVKEIELRFEDGKMIINPRHEDFPIQEVEIHEVKGELRKTVFNAAFLKSLFAGYQDEVTVDQQLILNLRGIKATIWRIYTLEKLTLSATIDEPDYEKIERYYREGRIKELEQEETA